MGPRPCSEEAVGTFPSNNNMAQNTMAAFMRLQKEIRMLADDPPPGVVAWPVENSNDRLDAQITGPEDSPYSRGTFHLGLLRTPGVIAHVLAVVPVIVTLFV
jgi:hypothetical protein